MATYFSNALVVTRRSNLQDSTDRLVRWIVILVFSNHAHGTFRDFGIAVNYVTKYLVKRRVTGLGRSVESWAEGSLLKRVAQG